MLLLNRDMSSRDRREKFNLSLPGELMEAFVAVSGKYGSKRKYLSFAAAMLTFLETDDAIRDYYVQQVAAAEVGPGFSSLLNRAKSGELRREAERSKPLFPGLIPASQIDSRREAASASTPARKGMNRKGRKE